MTEKTGCQKASKTAVPKADQEGLPLTGNTHAADASDSPDMETSSPITIPAPKTENSKLSAPVLANPQQKLLPTMVGSSKSEKTRKRKSSDYRNAKRLLRQLPLSALLQVGKWIPDRIAHLAHATQNISVHTGEEPTASKPAENPISTAK